MSNIILVAMKRRTKPALCFLALTLFAVLLRAQQTPSTGNVYGRVYDHNGRPLPNVLLIMTSERLNYWYSDSSQNDGSFNFNKIKPGVWVLTAVDHDKQIDMRKEVQVTAGVDTAVTPPLRGHGTKESPIEDIYTLNCLGRYYEGLKEPGPDYTKAMMFYRLAADKGSTLAVDNIGNMYRDGLGVPKDPAEAAKWYRKAAELDNAFAQNHLGLLYDQGIGVNKDLAGAAEWFRKAAYSGLSSAQYNLAQAYFLGKGVEKSSELGFTWLNRAAAQQFALAENELGYRYQRGDGVSKDYAQAMDWYRKAANHGNANAYNNIGIMYQNGYGVKKDDAIALQWFRKSADMGNAWGQFDVGYMYENGYGIEKDKETALKWYRAAAQQGNKEAQSRLEELNKTSDSAPVSNVKKQTLSLQEVEDMLSNGVTPKRLELLVARYGVDFALDQASVVRLKGQGADDALLVAIATSKK